MVFITMLIEEKASYKAEWVTESSFYKIRVEVYMPMFIINRKDKSVVVWSTFGCYNTVKSNDL